MNCEQAMELLSAQLDHEIPADDKTLLEHHLGDCPGCRATRDALRTQDGELRESFEPRRRAAVAIAEKVSEKLRAAPAGQGGTFPRPSWPRLAAAFGIVAAAAAVLIIVLLNHKPIDKGPPDSLVQHKPDSSYEQLTPRPHVQTPPPPKLASGERIKTM